MPASVSLVVAAVVPIMDNPATPRTDNVFFDRLLLDIRFDSDMGLLLLPMQLES
jgi:hypothetical protein